LPIKQIEPEPQEANSNPDEVTRADIRGELEAGAAGMDESGAEAIAELKARIAELEQAILLKDEDIGALKKSLELTRQELEGAKTAYAGAVADFKRLAMEQHPLIPAEIVTGNTIDEVKASIQQASDLVAKVKQAIQEQAQEVQVPAGAPPRTEPDLSALSPREKIQHAIRNKQK
jgi:multidrug resistance efflux pump